MRSPEEIRREMDNRPAWTEPPAKKNRPTSKSAKSQYRESTPRTPKPTASDRSSVLAQRWYDLGEREGFAFPYNSNFFALALQAKIEQDTEIKKFIKAGKHDQVQRWVRKMIDLWWAPVDEYDQGGYITNEINASNAKGFFLDKDWEDLRDYARSCLRAAYLKDHHKVSPKPVHYQNLNHQHELGEIHDRAVVDQHLRRLAEEPAPERGELDPEGRERLRSFRDKRRNK